MKNKDTGIDLTVPTFKHIPGLLSSTYIYQVVAVSNLTFFKSPKHKESDTVQFMVGNCMYIGLDTDLYTCSREEIIWIKTQIDKI